MKLACIHDIECNALFNAFGINILHDKTIMYMGYFRSRDVFRGELSVDGSFTHDGKTRYRVSPKSVDKSGEGR